MDWFHVNSRWVTLAGIVVVVAVVVAWYVQTSRTRKAENADKQLVLAKQSMQPGNPNVQLAEADLGKVADRYAGTPAGAEAGLLLGQLKLEKGDYQGAVTYLKGLAEKLASGPNASAVRGLLGDAYAQQEKPADAAAEYERAAGLTTMPNEKAYLLSKAGHAYMAAGKHPEARRIWEGLAASQDSPSLAAEARVRLGELVASPAKS